MEVYHLIKNDDRCSARKLNSILERGLFAGEERTIYARPFELPANMEWVSFDVDPEKAVVRDQRFQGMPGYAASEMTLERYLEAYAVDPSVSYEEFLLRRQISDYLPEVHVRVPQIPARRFLRYSDGKRIRRSGKT